MKLGVIGFGNMGGAIVKGALNKGVIAADDVCVFDICTDKVKEAVELGINGAAGNEPLCADSDIVLLAVKPQQMLEALSQAGGALDGKCVLSIVAGKTVDSIKEAIDGEVRVLRIMPNTPALVNEGAFALCSDNDLRNEEKDFAEDLFSALGIVEWLKEYDIDAVCGLSGGGPAYAAMFIEALADGGVAEGLPRAVAMKLAAQTVLGTARMIMETGLHPGAVKDMVSSPAGTTVEGVRALEAGGMRSAVIECVVEATERSRELQHV